MMYKEVVYGIGGHCENCDPSHDHPLNNIIEVIEVPDAPVVEEPVNADAEALAQALTQLPQETLNALKQALGI